MKIHTTSLVNYKLLTTRNGYESFDLKAYHPTKISSCNSVI
uniref:Uncharacterized protein n=1 Tax=Arundo donax TaxID=35708 RepID=A0A0A9BA20_ARUDO